jgi:hypothetical protein
MLLKNLKHQTTELDFMVLGDMMRSDFVDSGTSEYQESANQGHVFGT